MKVDFTNTGKIEFEKKLRNTQKSKSDSITKSTKNGDILEISEDYKKLAPIVSRLKSGYYDQNEVLQETASRINLEI